MFSCEFCKIYKNTFFTEQLWTTVSKNSKYNSEYFQNKNNNDSNQIEKFVTPKEPQTPKHQTTKILTILYPSAVLKY